MGSIENSDAVSSNVPIDLSVIDYRQFSSQSPEIRNGTLKQLDEAFQKYGFIYLSNYSIPQDLVDEAFQWSKKFFTLPHEVKQSIAHPPSGEIDDHRGFAEVGLAIVQELRKTSPERKETLEMGNPHPNDDGPPNRYVSEDILPGFRAFMEKWWDECTILEHGLLRYLGQSLHLEDEQLLERRQTRDVCHMSWAYYPSMPVATLKSRQLRRLNAHTDFGQLTLLFQDMVGGLEVHDGQTFRPVIPKPGTVIVNVGDMLERQSNGRWKSALHQVVAPREDMIQDESQIMWKDDKAVADRYSIIYFGTPDPESIVDTLPNCEVRGNWKPNMIGDWDEKLTAGAWIQKRLAAEY